MSSSKAARALLALPLALIGASVVIGQPAPAPAPGVEEDTVAAQAPAAGRPADPRGSAPDLATAQPTISLASLGHDHGISFTQLDGKVDLVFRVPVGAWLSGARLRLPYRSWIARPTPRTLTVLSGEEVLGKFPIDGDGVVDIPIPPEALARGEFPVSLAYVGGLIPYRCSDDRLAGDRLLFDPNGGLVLEPSPGSQPPIAAVVATLGTQPAIALPVTPNEAQAAAALTIVAGRGKAVFADHASGSNGIVQVGGASEPALKAVGPTRLIIGGADPAGTARAVFGGSAVFPDTPQIDRLSVAPASPAALFLSDIGAGAATVNVNKTHSWTVTLPASRIPDGRSIRGLSLNVATVGAGPEDRVSAWLNGALLGSVPVNGSGITKLNVRARDSLTNSINTIMVRIDRPEQGDCGERHLAMPAQLLETSSVLLGPIEPRQDFHDFSSASAKGVTVVVPGPAMLPLAARAVSALIGVNVPIRVSYGALPKDGPAIVIADSPPGGTTPPLSTANGRMVLTSSKSGADFDLPQSPSDTIVQLLDGEGGPILWIRPAPSGAVPATMWLNQGDVAIVNQAGMIQALSTSRPRLEAPTEMEPSSWWDRNAWRVFVIAGLLLGTGLVFWALRPSVKRARPGRID